MILCLLNIHLPEESSVPRRRSPDLPPDVEDDVLRREQLHRTSELVVAQRCPKAEFGRLLRAPRRIFAPH